MDYYPRTIDWELTSHRTRNPGSGCLELGLDEALAVIRTAPGQAGALGYWGLAALALDRSSEAIGLLKQSVRLRCYAAPVLLATPFLTPYASTPAVQLFRQRMGRAFVTTL